MPENATGSPTAGTPAERPDAEAVGQALAGRVLLPALTQLVNEHAQGSAEYTTDELLAAVYTVKRSAIGMETVLLRILAGGGRQ